MDGSGNDERTPESVSEHVGGRLKILAVLASAVAIDSIFMAAWVAINWSLDRYVLEPMRLSGSDGVLLGAFHYLFGGTTLIAVLIYTVEDIITIAWQAIQRVKTKFRKGDK